MTTSDIQKRINQLSESLIELSGSGYFVGKRKKVKALNIKIRNLNKRKLYKEKS
jgi:hypothetical protein